MPTYEYLCPAGHEFEKFQKMTDKPRAKCPVCGKPATRKISGGAGLVFRGSGFYITDYGKDGKGPRKASEGEKGGDASSSKSETKETPAPAKSESKADTKSKTKKAAE
jgi:putative FmdB family regulatory protein